MKIPLSLFFCLLCAACQPGHSLAAEQLAAICYAPFSSGTSSPITRVNFPSRCTDLGKLKVSDPRFRRLTSAIAVATTPATFDNSRVRVRIVTSDQRTIFIDQVGGVDANGTLSRLSNESLWEVEDMLEGLDEQVGPAAAYPDQRPAAKQFATLCHVPLADAASGSITRANFSDKCHVLGKRKFTDRRLGNLLFEIEKAPHQGTFNEDAVFLRIVRPDDRTIFIDNRGAIHAQGKTRQMSPDSFSKFKKILGWVIAERSAP